MLLMMIFGIAFSAIMPAIDRWSKGYFITFFSMLLLSVSVFYTDIIIYKIPDMAQTERVLVFLEFLSVSPLMQMPTVLMLHRCGESIKKSLLFRAVLAIWGVYLIVLIIAQFTDAFYYIAPVLPRTVVHTDSASDGFDDGTQHCGSYQTAQKALKKVLYRDFSLFTADDDGVAYLSV